MKRMKKAFTITELIIVIAVIAILAAVLIPTFTHVVESANRSAALQTSHNALTEYLSMISTDDKTDNDDATGVVFVSNNYAFVYLNGGLQYIGKTGDLASLTNKGGTVSKKEKASGITFSETFTDKVMFPNTTLKEIPLSTLNKLETATEQEPTIHEQEMLYFYTVKVNKTTYNGYFTYEDGNKSEGLQINGASYSRLAGVVNTVLEVAASSTPTPVSP